MYRGYRLVPIRLPGIIECKFVHLSLPALLADVFYGQGFASGMDDSGGLHRAMTIVCAVPWAHIDMERP